MAFYDDAFYDSEAHYDEADVTSPPPRMAFVKLELKSRDNENLRTFAEGHRDAMVGNANFTTPAPTVLVFNADLDNFVAGICAEEAARDALTTAVKHTATMRKILEGRLTSRGSYVQEASGGVAEKITSSHFGVRDEATPTSSLPAPGDFRVTFGDMPGQNDTQWDPVPRAVAYITEFRENVEGTAFQVGKIGTTSRAKITGLGSGKEYVFRVRAIGPNDVEGPWSDVAIKRAP